MHFETKYAKCARPVILHRSEWNRLQTQAGPPEEPSQQNNEYLKALIEQSQAWIKTWPDTVQGCVALKQKQNERKRADEIAAVEAFSKNKIHNNKAKVIQKARQKIFDESCYGRKLISAVRESKALEERDAQIQFMKEINEKEVELEKKQRKSVTFCTFDLDKKSEANEEQQKRNIIQNSKENKEMFQKQKEDEAKAREQEKLSELTDTQLMKYLLDREREAEDIMKRLEKEALEQCAADHRKTKEERQKWEAEYYANIEKCRIEQEELNCKITQIQKSQDSALTKRNYEVVQKCQEEEKKRYEDFINKNSKLGEKRAEKRERKEEEKKIQNRNKKATTAEINKRLAEYVRLRECNNKCFCDRQCLITKSDKDRNIKKGKGEIEVKETTKECKGEPELKLLYFAPCNKLMAALRQREQAPSPWTGGAAAHELFVKNAKQTLRESKYKIPARKVVEEYMKHNALDVTSLPTSHFM